MPTPDRSANERPLLSIAIPTYNRAQRLRIALEALLPQTERLGDKVEVIVSDNASEDDTRAVVDTFRRRYSVGYSRNASNLGPIRNTVRLATELSSGRYVWILGDDDLVEPVAVPRVVSAIEAYPWLEVLYLNFRVARFPDDWPEHAHGGFTGSSGTEANRDLGLSVLRRWKDVVRPESEMATQVYAHIVRRRVWQEYWSDRPIGEPYSAARWTWPHTYMIAETLSGNPCLYIGNPVLTIFEGGQTWTEQLPVVVLLRVPELLGFYDRIGVSPDAVERYRDANLRAARPHLVRLMQARNRRSDPSPGSFLAANRRHVQAWWTYLGAFADAKPWSIGGALIRAARRGNRALREVVHRQGDPR